MLCIIEYKNNVCHTYIIDQAAQWLMVEFLYAETLQNLLSIYMNLIYQNIIAGYIKDMATSAIDTLQVSKRPLKNHASKWPAPFLLIGGVSV